MVLTDCTISQEIAEGWIGTEPLIPKRVQPAGAGLRRGKKPAVFKTGQYPSCTDVAKLPINLYY